MAVVAASPALAVARIPGVGVGVGAGSSTGVDPEAFAGDAGVLLQNIFELAKSAPGRMVYILPRCMRFTGGVRATCPSRNAQHAVHSALRICQEQFSSCVSSRQPLSFAAAHPRLWRRRDWANATKKNT